MINNSNIVNIQDHVVKADVENGFDRLAHTLTDALAMNDPKLSGCQFQIILAIISKTYRWHKKSDWICYEQLAEITGMSKKHIGKEVRQLIQKNVLIKNGNQLGINNIVSEWESNQLVAKKQPISSQTKATNQFPQGNQLVPTGNQLVAKRQPITPPQKKETITKETITKEKSKTRKQTLLEINPPDFISKDSIQEFIEHRKSIKKPMTQLALDKFINRLVELHNQGYESGRLIDAAILSGWQTVYPKKEDRLMANNQFSEKSQKNIDLLQNMELE